MFVPFAPKIYVFFIHTLLIANNPNHVKCSGGKKGRFVSFGLQLDGEVISRTAAHHFPEAIGKR